MGIHIGLWTAVICHCQALPSRLPYGRPGVVGEEEEEEDEEEDDDEGRIEPSRVTRADVYALSERTPRLYILYTRALREEGGRYIVRHVMYIRDINKAPYCVNYVRAACRHS